MNRFIFSILFLLYFVSGIFAQSNVRFGIHGGINTSLLTGIDKPKNYTKGRGFDGGMYLETRVRNYMSAWFELNYTQRKTSFEEPIKSVSNSWLKVTEANDYVEFPFYFRFRKGDETLKSFVNIGGAVSLNTFKRRKSSVTILNFPVDPADYYNYKVNFFDYGFSTSAGIQINAVYFEGKYYLSLRNLYCGNDYREIRYMTFGVTVGYEINYPYAFKTHLRKVPLKQKIKHQWNSWFK